MRIIVNPDELRYLAQQLRGASSELRGVGTRIGSALSALDWEARQKAGVDAQVNQARGRANALASQAEELARYLDHKAQAFQEADQHGVCAMGQIASQFAGFQRWMPSSGAFYDFPTIDASAQLKMGAIAGGVSPVFITQLPNFVQFVDRSKTILLAGRTKIGNWVPWAPDLRKYPWRSIKGGTPSGFLLDTALEFISHPEDWNLRGGEIAVTKTLIEVGLGMTGIGFAALVANAAIQLGGSTLIWGTKEIAQAISPQDGALIEKNAAKAQKALEKIDLGRITRDVATVIVDLGHAHAQAAFKVRYDMWQQPSVWNVLRSGLLASPSLGLVTTLLLDSEARDVVTKDMRQLGDHAVGFGTGLVEAPYRLGYHLGMVEASIGSALIDRVNQACMQTLMNMVAASAN